MSVSNSIQHELSYIPEVTYGTTPASTPAFQPIPITGTNIALSKGTIESGIIRPNRQVSDVRHGNRQVGGDINCELVYGAFDAFLEALLCGTWTSDVLVPGTTQRSFSILRKYLEVAASGVGYPFHLYKGVEINKLALSFAPESFIKADFGIFGRELALANAVPSGATFEDISTAKPFDNFSGTVLVDGSAVGHVTEIQLTIDNGIAPRFVLFDDKTIAPKIGKCRVTGNLNLFFQDSSFLSAFNAGNNRSLEFTVTDPGNNSYNFVLPNILGTSSQADVQGESDVMTPFPFTALYDGEDQLTITRIPD